MMTTVRMVQSTMAAMPTAKEMKEKFRASREAISADTKSPRAKAVRTYRGGAREGGQRAAAHPPQPPSKKMSMTPKTKETPLSLKAFPSLLPRPTPARP